MKDWILKILKKSSVFITIASLTWIIGEVFRPIYYTSISAMGQAGNFFVNLYFASAARISLSTVISFLTSMNISFLLSIHWFVLLKSLKKN